MAVAQLQAVADFERGDKAALALTTTRGRILDAARQHLRSGSYAELSLDGVAKSAGVLRRAVLGQFADKDELYRESRRSMLVALAEEFLVEIPRGMRPKDALNFYLHVLYDLCSDARMREIRASAVRDRRTQPWLAQSLDRLLTGPLSASIEAFLLRTAHCRDVPPETAGAIARQLWSIAADLAERRAAVAAGTSNRLDAELEGEIALAAKAYGTILFHLSELA